MPEDAIDPDASLDDAIIVDDGAITVDETAVDIVVDETGETSDYDGTVIAADDTVGDGFDDSADGSTYGYDAIIVTVDETGGDGFDDVDDGVIYADDGTVYDGTVYDGTVYDSVVDIGTIDGDDAVPGEDPRETVGDADAGDGLVYTFFFANSLDTVALSGDVAPFIRTQEAEPAAAPEPAAAYDTEVELSGFADGFQFWNPFGGDPFFGNDALNAGSELDVRPVEAEAVDLLGTAATVDFLI
jgi:hypothetical protein